jgi:bifunctional non-homologous end joining protein LigD
VCILDLDPLQDDIDTLRAATLAVRDLVAELGLTSFMKTTGSKGFHIAVPLNGQSDAGEVSSFAGIVGDILVARYPKMLTQEFSKADRGGRIYVDTGRNHPPATFAVAYAVRPKPGAPVSAPCTWEEIEKGKVEPQTFTVRNMAARVTGVGDPWSTLHDTPHALAAILKKLRAQS